MKKIFVIDDDELFAECIEKAILKLDAKIEVKKFSNAMEVMEFLNEPLPDLIFLDILLPGVDGFTFLNEISSYKDTAKIPIILCTSLKLPETDLSIYNIQGILDKERMKPEEVQDYVKRYAK